MKLRFLLLISIFYFLLSTLFPSPSLAAHSKDCLASDGSKGCMTRDKCIDPTTGKSFYIQPFSEQCNELSLQNPSVNFVCCVTGSGPKPCEADNSCVEAPTTPTTALCGTGVNLNKGVNTAIGCLMAGEPKVFISQLLGWGVGVGGGIAFLMIVFAGFQIATAAGDPKRVQAAKELLTSAISGLILIVLSVLLLNFIGVKILHLPGFAL